MNVKSRYLEKTVNEKSLFNTVLSGFIEDIKEDECMDIQPDKSIQSMPEDVLKNRLRIMVKNIENYAVNKNFQKAESIRHALYLAAPNAIKEIYESGKIIEKEKNRIHFNRLKRVLNNDEYSALINTLTNVTFKKDTIIIKKGMKSANLFLINEGSISITAGNESPVSLKPGCVLGVGSFFPGKMAKARIASAAGTNADYLTESDLRTLLISFPDIKKKLYQFSQDSVNELNYMNQRISERRAHTRYKLDGFVSARIMDSSMKPSGDSIRGTFIDISSGGISFRFSSNSGTLLKGKNATIVLEPAGIKTKRALTWIGRFIDVKETGNFEYSAHFKGEVLKKSVSGLIARLKQRQN